MTTVSLNSIADALRAALVLPGGVGVALLDGAAVPAAVASRALPAPLRHAGAARRSSFLRGRYCAAEALAAIGMEAAFPLPIGPGGLPDWPDRTIGSISHSDGAAIALAARCSEVRWLGVDLEPLASVRHAGDIAALVASDVERAAIARHDPALAPLIAFCAKEALYKAMLPGRFLDFTAAAIVASAPGHCTLTLTLDWTPRCQAGTHIEVRWALTGEHLVAATCG